MLAMTFVLLKIMLSLVSVECLATADHWFSSLVCPMWYKILVEM
jgi:hypothetical protein